MSPEPRVSAQMRARIDHEMARFPDKRGALLAALHLVEEAHGHVGPDSVKEVAALFDLPPIEVMEVASFYNMFHPRPGGRHRVYVCTNLPCSLRGARSLLRELEAHLGIRSGETTPDGRISLGHEECLGACAYAPMFRIGATYHENLGVEEAKRLLDALE